MPPRHVGPLPGALAQLCRMKGSLRVPDPKGAARAKLCHPQPWCFCSAGGWREPNARPGAAGVCVSPRGVTRAGQVPVLPSLRQHRLLLFRVPVLRAQHPWC